MLNPGFYRGEWGSGSDLWSFLVNPSFAESAYWDGERFWHVPFETTLAGGDVLDEIRAACLELIGQGIEPTDQRIERIMNRHRDQGDE